MRLDCLSECYTTMYACVLRINETICRHKYVSPQLDGFGEALNSISYIHELSASGGSIHAVIYYYQRKQHCPITSYQTWPFNKLAKSP